MKILSKLLLSLLLLASGSGILKAQEVEVTVKTTRGSQEIVSIIDGVSYIFKTNRPVDFTAGKTIVFPDSTDALLTEIREGKKIEAELRIIGDDYKLLFIEEGFFADFYKNEDDWMSHFFQNIIQSQKTGTAGAIIEIEKEFAETDSMDESKVNESSIDVFLNTLKSIVLENDRAELLSTRIKKGTNIKEQKKIIGFIFSNFNLEQSKADLIKQLLDHPTYSKVNNDFLMSFVDQFVLESNKISVLKKLLD